MESHRSAYECYCSLIREETSHPRVKKRVVIESVENADDYGFVATFQRSSGQKLTLYLFRKYSNPGEFGHYWYQLENSERLKTIIELPLWRIHPTLYIFRPFLIEDDEEEILRRMTIQSFAP